VRVDHKGQGLFGTNSQAVVYDEYLSNSTLVDISTGLDIPTSELPFLQQISFLMHKENGTWKVNDAVRHN
jgi:hypothetical protein